MKRIILLAIVCLMSTFCAPTQDKCSNGIEVPRFKLYHTENVYTSLKLDTATGRIWQVQMTIGSVEPAITEIENGNVPTISKSDPIGAVPGRFELYSTQNMYNFILIDTTDGRCWQVQWSMSADNRLYYYLGEK